MQKNIFPMNNSFLKAKKAALTTFENWTGPYWLVFKSFMQNQKLLAKTGNNLQCQYKTKDARPIEIYQFLYTYNLCISDYAKFSLF
jgi:hypothetical protein